MSQTFSYVPDFSSKSSLKPNVRVAKFGDGYEQRVQFGINANPQNWSLVFNLRSDTETSALTGFLFEMGAVTSFFWTPPDAAAAVKFVCRQWSKSPVHGQGTPTAPAYLWNISALFEQVFEP